MTVGTGFTFFIAGVACVVLGLNMHEKYGAQLIGLGAVLFALSGFAP
jgi:hypothetical protein